MIDGLSGFKREHDQIESRRERRTQTMRPALHLPFEEALGDEVSETQAAESWNQQAARAAALQKDYPVANEGQRNSGRQLHSMEHGHRRRRAIPGAEQQTAQSVVFLKRADGLTP